MAHPLDAIYAKLERADEGVKTLNREARDFLTADPRPYEIRFEFDDNLKAARWKIYERIAIPLRLSVITGEVLHHCRSAFDHLVSALVAARGEPPLNTHQFPICRKREKFEKAIRGGNVKGISASAFDLIEKMQPYNHRTPESYTLNIIHLMDNISKHRTVLVVSAAATLDKNLTIKGPKFYGPHNPIKITDFFGRVGQATKDGEDFFLIQFERATSQFHADVNIAMQVAFDKPGTGEIVPVIPNLTKMVGFTKKVIRDFTREF